MESTKEYIDGLKNALESINQNEIEKISDILMNAYETEKAVFIIGNGGSASTASHFACDLGKGTLERHYDMNKKRFRAYSLTDNVALLTAYGNDLSYEDIFSQQLKNLIRKDDILIVLTGSGNSNNIINAVKLAKDIGATTIGLLGFDGGKVSGMLDHKIIVKSSNYGIIEDMHLMLEHIFCQNLKKRIN